MQLGDTITVVLSTGREVLLTATSAGTSLSGTYVIATGDTAADLNVVSYSVGTATDAAGNAISANGIPTGSNNIAGSSAIVIDTTAPTFFATQSAPVSEAGGINNGFAGSSTSTSVVSTDGTISTDGWTATGNVNEYVKAGTYGTATLNISTPSMAQFI